VEVEVEAVAAVAAAAAEGGDSHEEIQIINTRIFKGDENDLT
jgi:hypothetical protein